MIELGGGGGEADVVVCYFVRFLPWKNFRGRGGGGGAQTWCATPWLHHWQTETCVLEYTHGADTRGGEGSGGGADCGRSYLGEKSSFSRLERHMYDARTKVSSNVLAEHAEATGHEIDRNRLN